MLIDDYFFEMGTSAFEVSAKKQWLKIYPEGDYEIDLHRITERHRTLPVYVLSNRAFESIKELVAYQTEAKPPHEGCFVEAFDGLWLVEDGFFSKLCKNGSEPLRLKYSKHVNPDPLLQAIFAALESKSCQMEKHEPDAALQKARKRRGKAPLRDYTYVDLSPSPPHETGDGTRGPFRRHPVRGHWRAVEGRAIYVKPHWRGCLTVGMAPLRRKVM